MLERPGYSFATRDLVDGRLPRGAYATPCSVVRRPDGVLRLRRSARRAAPAQAGNRLDDSPGCRPRAAGAELLSRPSASRFTCMRWTRAGSDLRQLTTGREDDFDPCPLAGWRAGFMSSRRGGFCRCDNPFEPIPTHTLHRLDPLTGDVTDVVVARDERMASFGAQRRSHRLLPLGLRGPLGRPLSWFVGQQSGRSEPGHPVRQLHAEHQHLFPAPGRPQFEQDRVCGRRPSCECGRLARVVRPGAQAAGCGDR